MNPGRKDSLLRQACFTAAVFLAVFGCVYLGTVTAKVVSVDMTAKPQAAALGAGSFWCSLKGLFGFPCPEDTLKVEYAIVAPGATKREDPAPNTAASSSVEAALPGPAPAAPAVVTTIRPVERETIREVVIRDQAVDTSRFITRDEYDRQVDGLLRSIENIDSDQGGGGITAETDPIYTASTAFTITGTDVSDWQAAFSASQALSASSTFWDQAFGWGDHSQAGYLTSFTETDPIFVGSDAFNITAASTTEWSTAYSWGDHALSNYLTTELDPIFSTSPAFGISGTNISNWNSAYTAVTASSSQWGSAYTLANLLNSASSTWNQAYSWGDHSAENYIQQNTDATLDNATTTNLHVQGYLTTNYLVTNLADGCVEVVSGVLTSLGLNCGTSTSSAGILNLNGLTSSGQTFNPASSGGLSFNISSVGSIHTFSIAPAVNHAIPLAASTTAWNNAANTVVASSSFWNTAYSWGDHAAEGYLTGLGTSTFNGNISMAGHIIPAADITYDLGSPERMWRDVYIGPGSLYINGKKVLEDVSNTITFTTDNNQNLAIETKGAGNINTEAVGSGNVNLTSHDGNVGVSAGSGNINITSASGNLNIGTTGSGQLNLGTINQGVWHGTDIDISDYTNLTVSATGLTLSGDSIALASGYLIPLSASTTAWNDFYNTPSSRLTAGTGLYWNGNTLNASSSADINYWTLSSNNVYRASGNVGIGTTSPSQALSVSGNMHATGSVLSGVDTPIDTGVGFIASMNALAANVGGTFMNTNANGYEGFNFYNNAGTLVSSLNHSNSGATVLPNSTWIGTRNAELFHIVTNGVTPRLTIDATGNVGIGTTNPGAKLEVATGTYTGNTHYQNSTLRVNAGFAGGYTPGTIVSLLSAYDSTIYGADIGYSYNGGGAGYNLSFSTNDDTSGNPIERMRILANGNVGIGTTTPGARLSISDTSNSDVLNLTGTVTGAKITFRDSVGNLHGRIGSVEGLMTGAAADSVGLFSQNEIWFGTNANATARMVINSSGNVGIGTTSPGARLDVYGSSNRVLRAVQEASSLSSGTYTFEVDSSAHTANQSLAGAMKVDVSSGRAFTINGQGNVGVGTTTPENKLDVYQGNIRLATDTNTTNYLIWERAGTDRARQYVNSSNALSFEVGGSDRMTITSSGNIGIGTTTPGEKLTVEGGILARAVAPQLKLQESDNSDNYYNLVVDSGTFGIRYNNAYPGPFQITSSGNVGIGTADPIFNLDVVGLLRTTSDAYFGYNAGVTGGLWMANPSHYGKPAIQSLTSSFGGDSLLLNPAGGTVGIGTSTPGSLLTVAGNIYTTSDLYSEESLYLLGNGSGNAVRVGYNTPGNQYSYIDLIGDSTYADYGLRLLRGNTGPNTESWIQHRGTGPFHLWATEAAPIIFSASSTERMRITPGGNVGIGTVDPNYLTHIVGASSPGDVTTARQMAIGVDNNPAYNVSLGYYNTNTGLGWAGVLQARDNNAGSALLLNPSGGNVGIGTTTPQAKLSVSGNVRIDGNSQLQFWNTSGSAGNSIQLDSAASSQPGLSFNTSGSQRMVVDANGNVGIGTTGPGERLTVAGNILASSSGYAAVTAKRGDDTNAADFYLTNAAADKGWLMSLRPNSDHFSIVENNAGSFTERLSINPGGDVGMSTALFVGGGIQSNTGYSLSGAAGLDRLFNYNTNGTQRFAVGLSGVAESGGNVGSDFFIHRYDDSGNWQGAPFMIERSTGYLGLGGVGDPTVQLHTLGNVRFESFGAGTLQTDASGNLSVSSDTRLKDLEGTFDRGLEAILGIEPIMYRWNAASGYDRSTLYAGFSAQNVEDFIPEAVGTNPDGYLSLSDRPLLAAVINAVKEMWTKMEEYFARTERLEAEVEALKAEVNALKGEEEEPPEDTGGGGGADETEAQTDLCSNIDGLQTEMPADHTLDDQGQCVLEPPADPAPAPDPGGDPIPPTPPAPPSEVPPVTEPPTNP